MKKQRFILGQGTYDFEVMVSLGESHEAVCKAIEKKGYKLSEEETERLKMYGCGRTVLLKGGQIILRIKLDKNRAKFIGCLTHELFHVVEFLFDVIGIKHDVSTSSEAFAYQIGYLMENIYKRIKW